MSLPKEAPTFSPLRICVLQPTASPAADPAPEWAELAATIRQAGHRLTLAMPDETGLEFIPADGSAGDATRVTPNEPDRLVGPRAARVAYQVHLWLAREAFDVVVAPAQGGALFYALVARAQGLDLQGTTCMLWVDGLTLLDLHRAQQMPRGMDDVVQDEMERQALALADRVACLDPAAEAWMQERRWPCSDRLLRSGTRPEAVLALLQAEIARPLVPPEPAPRAAADAEVPLVSVCIPHFNRVDLLRQAIASIRSQDYPRIEIIVVDDASDRPEVTGALDAVAADLARDGGRLVRHAANQYLGAARNTAAQHARGDYLLFLDDDDYAKPDQVSTLVRVARHTGADIVNSLFDRLAGLAPPAPDQRAEERWLALGNAPASGVFTNLFGPAAALVRTSSFAALGGFTPVRGVGSEDWELFARATLAGMNLQLVPRALFWYRMTPDSMVQTADGYAGNLRGLAPYLALVPEIIRPTLQFAQSAGQRLAVADSRIEGMQTIITSCFEQIADLQRHIVAQDAEFATARRHIEDLHAALDSTHAHLRARLATLESLQRALDEANERTRVAQAHPAAPSQPDPDAPDCANPPSRLPETIAVPVPPLRNPAARVETSLRRMRRFLRRTPTRVE